jgi:hypothetical protein
MATPDRNGGAVAGVRLIDVDIRVRRRYGRVLLDRAIKEMDPLAAVEFAAQLHMAVEAPSTKIYWVSREAAERVLL